MLYHAPLAWEHELEVVRSRDTESALDHGYHREKRKKPDSSPHAGLW